MVTDDESWYYYHIPTSDKSSLTWKSQNVLHALKTKLKTLTGRVMLMLFFYISGPALAKWMPKGTTINAVEYVDTLMKLV